MATIDDGEQLSQPTGKNRPAFGRLATAKSQGSVSTPPQPH
jgi:hypothetical protein